MSRIKNHDVLRRKVQSTEAKMKKLMDSCHYGYSWIRFETKKAQMRDLLAERQRYLDRMFLATPGEVERFERINELFIRKADEMRARSAMLYESLRHMKTMPEFDDIYEVEGSIRVLGDRSDEECIIHLPEDEYYGSDFLLAAEALNDIMPHYWNHAHCGRVIKLPDLQAEKFNPCDDFTDSTEDGLSWAESSLVRPELEHICICYPIHDICTHNLYSIPDLLRINSIHVRVALTIQNSITQDGVRSIEPGYRSWR